MIRYLLDTNAIIALLNPKSLSVREHAKQHSPSEICISSIVTHELFYGAFKSQRKKENLNLVDSLPFTVLEFDKEDSRQAGEIRALLPSRGLPMGSLDTLIAGQAQARNLILVTHNTKEFARIPGLQMEDWEKK